MKLYLVLMRGEPGKRHPLFFEVGVTAIKMILLAEDAPAAERKARDLVAMMQIEAETLLKIYGVDEERFLTNPPDWAKQFRNDGMAYQVIHLAVGIDMPSDLGLSSD